MTRPLITRNALLVGAAVVAAVVALALFVAPNPSTPDDDGDPWTGRWLINGLSAQDTEYSGSLTILATGAGYELQWLVTGDIALGTAELSGERLEARWESRSSVGAAATGTASYVLQADGRLVGERTIDGVPGTGSEEGEPAA